MQKIGVKKNCHFFTTTMNENKIISPLTSTHSKNLMGKCDEIKARDF